MTLTEAFKTFNESTDANKAESGKIGDKLLEAPTVVDCMRGLACKTIKEIVTQGIDPIDSLQVSLLAALTVGIMVGTKWDERK